MAVSIVVFMFIGHWLDVWLGIAPWLFLVGALVGISVAFYGFFRRVMPSGGGPEGKP